jgi:hypothetical protein
VGGVRRLNIKNVTDIIFFIFFCIINVPFFCLFFLNVFGKFLQILAIIISFYPFLSNSCFADYETTAGFNNFPTT